ncbi:Crp/Fnr family transcriptional regulator [Propioniferax innocua]|uniref:CRP/FNR family transcriptional regulator n=1 Tax=Propioniferax innocua TaxID=1753 RepID=A0A542ZBR0_9ACTN|nr:Crp/Fnr family transcriptional regulator [Propioniferax innocua]TQL57786.1 CRP/FNR family transcriptional regulator [Propioniferax innocua]
MTDLCVTQVPIFRHLSRPHQEAVAERARPLHAADGEYLYHQGAADAPLIILHEGAVKLTRVSSEGRERVIALMEPGDFSGESSLLTGARPDHSAIAVGDAIACSFVHRDFTMLLAQHPGVGMAMLGELSRRLGDAQDSLEQVASRSVEARIADHLLGLEASADLRVELQLPKKDVASMLGTTPESFSRGVTRLTEKGLVELDGPRGFILLDVDGLIEATRA